MNAFERLARFGLSRRAPHTSIAFTGAQDAADCENGLAWREHVTPRALWRAWGPPQESPWSAYHRPTLFAALECVREDHRWPALPPGLESPPREAPPWADARTAVLLDLPAPVSVAYGAWLARHAGHEPVATFNNWPHDKGVVPMWAALGALLHYVPWAVEARSRRRVGSFRHEAVPPPAFLLDADRLGRAVPKPGEYDNRYYLLDSDLPTPAAFQRAGIERVVYARPWGLHETDDLNRYLHDLAKRVPLFLLDVKTDAWAWGEPLAFKPEVRPTPLNTTRDPSFEGFRRNAAGGFGSLVPEPSSGSGG